MNGRFLCSAGMLLLLAVPPGRGVASPDSGGSTDITAPRERASGGGRRTPDPGKSAEKERHIEPGRSKDRQMGGVNSPYSIFIVTLI